MLTPTFQRSAVAIDRINFLKSLPHCYMRRGVRSPQWSMLLVANLAMLSNQGSLVGIEHLAIRHRKTLNQLLGTQIDKSPPDPTFGWLLMQAVVEGFHPDESLLCDGKTLRDRLLNMSPAQ